MEVAIEFIERGKDPDETTLLLEGLADRMQQSVADWIRSVLESDEKAAEDVISRKVDIRRLASEFLDHQAMRMHSGDQLGLVRLKIGLLDKLRRIYTLSKRMATEMVPGEVASKARSPSEKISQKVQRSEALRTRESAA